VGLGGVAAGQGPPSMGQGATHLSPATTALNKPANLRPTSPSIPADIRIIESFDLKVECSSLTGESDLVPATVDRHHDAAAGAGRTWLLEPARPGWGPGSLGPFNRWRPRLAVGAFACCDWLPTQCCPPTPNPTHASTHTATMNTTHRGRQPDLHVQPGHERRGPRHRDPHGCGGGAHEPQRASSSQAAAANHPEAPPLLLG
jgi:hypothetical protein